jgi:hypothetical protein
MMNRLRKFAAVLLSLAFFGTPALTCAFADSPMSSHAHACCRTMKSECGHKQMPASHDCCYGLATPEDNALIVKSAVVLAIAAPAVWLDATDLLNPATTSARAEHSGSSPPEAPPSTISILRI